MDPNKTWIDAPKTPAAPPEPPKPERNWLIIGLGMGGAILVLCSVAAFLIYRLVTGTPPAPESPATQLAQDISLTQTALVADVQALAETPTPSPLPEAAEPTAPPAPTDTTAPETLPSDTPPAAAGPPTFTANQDIFCRLGPSTIYEEVRTMTGGQTLPILGKGISPVDGTSIWWQVEIDGRRCFVSSGFGVTEGDTSGVPAVAAPPTPTPTPTYTPSPTPTATSTP
jgi:hypothetical protein